MSKIEPQQPLDRLTDALAIVAQYAALSEEDVASALHRSFKKNVVTLSSDVVSASLPDDQRYLISSMLTMWRSTAEFLDDEGAPTSVSLMGDSASLQSLHRQTCEASRGRVPDVPLQKIVDIMVEYKAIVPTEEGTYSPAQFLMLRTKSDGKAGAASLLTYAAEFLETGAHNVYEAQGGRFCRIARTKGFPGSKLSLVNGMLENQGMKFLEHIDKFIEEQKVADTQAEMDVLDIGIGLYMFQNSPEDK